MCGIVGAAARRDIVPVLVEGLRRLEYRGSDAGVGAPLSADSRRRAVSVFAAGVRAGAEWRGAFAIAGVAARAPEAVVVARRGPPLLLGLGDGENFAASDVSAVLPVTRRVVYLEDGDCAEIRPSGYRIVDTRGAPVERPVHVSEMTDESV